MNRKLLQTLTAIRRDLHRHPELAFEERRTSAIVAQWLEDLGLEVVVGVGGTGVVGTLRRKSGRSAIGLRADMDALPMDEENDFEHRSVHAGRFHGCGHDGHTTMLLGAAAQLASEGQFDGTVHFVFQPAEESAGGGRAMIEDGLFTRFPMDAIFGLHNYPDLRMGRIATRPGAYFAAYAEFDFSFDGKGGHSAFPHRAIDPLPAAAAFILNAQTVVSRFTDPLLCAVVSFTRLAAGSAYNVIPSRVTIAGSCRYFDVSTRDLIASLLERMAVSTAHANGCCASADFSERYPVLVNTPVETSLAIQAARDLGLEAGVEDCGDRVMGSEDFAFLLQQVPGAYVLLGAGGSEPSCSLHNPHYDFNEAIIPLGIRYWNALVHRALAPR